MGGGDLHDPHSSSSCITNTTTRNNSETASPRVPLSDPTDSDDCGSSVNSDDYSCSSSESRTCTTSSATKFNELPDFVIDDDFHDQCVS